MVRTATPPTASAVTGARTGTAHAAPLPIDTGWGPTAQEINRARALVGRLTLAERAGQVIYARYAGTAAPTDLVDRLHLGGIVVFADNYEDTDQIRASNATVQQAARRAGRDFPVGIGVDQEGGIVERVTGGTRFPAFMTAGAADDEALTRAAAQASGRELAGLGFNLDYAPDADVTIGRSDPTIGSRSAGSRPALVARQVVASARGYESTGVVPVLKHFPGHGSLTTDSHLALPVQRRSLSELQQRDLVPFKTAVAAGLPSIMVGHIDVRALDPGMPSSLSRKVVTGLLRDRLGFDGVVVTDSLAMHAVSDRFASGPAAVRALQAGNDVVLMPPSPKLARDGIVRAVREGRLSSARLVQAATRQVALLLHEQAAGLETAAPGSGSAASAAWSAAALTSVSGPCSGRLVGSRVSVSGPPTAVDRFRTAAAAAGLAVGRRGTTVRLIGYGGAAVRGDVVVATDTPYVLGDSAAPVRLATYGDTPGAMRALVDVLLGRAPAPGSLPVEVAGVPRSGC
ncbi:beta-N-acetylhexosaminidase [Nocardioides mesophilus]|uniref:beta-N-acetylhexosaminidase n=2 Tax=Nocardioides mesophilus TaxID=433659 RepID=A0A7G9RHF1_9ACTN|nr:beta-N-acetylhexosaminidase [Nocardioides mesophilus]